MVIFRRLGKDERRAYLAMTFPSFGSALQFDDRAVAIGADEAGTPIGLALACLPKEENEAPSLVSLFVNPAARRGGVGTELLRLLEDAIRDGGGKRLGATYMTGFPGNEAFERLAIKRGWNAPQTQMLVVRSTIPAIRKAP